VRLKHCTDMNNTFVEFISAIRNINNRSLIVKIPKACSAVKG